MIHLPPFVPAATTAARVHRTFSSVAGIGTYVAARA